MNDGLVMVAAIVMVLLPALLLLGWDLITSYVKCGHCSSWHRVLRRREPALCKLCRAMRVDKSSEGAEC